MRFFDSHIRVIRTKGGQKFVNFVAKIMVFSMPDELRDRRY